MYRANHFQSDQIFCLRPVPLLIPSTSRPQNPQRGCYGFTDAFRLQPPPPDPPSSSPSPVPSPTPRGCAHKAAIMGMAGSTAKITKFFEKAVGRVRGSTGGRDPSVDSNAAGGTRPSSGLASLLAFRVPCLLQFARVMMFLGL